MAGRDWYPQIQGVAHRQEIVANIAHHRIPVDGCLTLQSVLIRPIQQLRLITSLITTSYFEQPLIHRSGISNSGNWLQQPAEKY